MKKHRDRKSSYGKSSPRRIGVSPELPDVTITKTKVKDVHYLSSIYPSEEIMLLVEELIAKEEVARQG